METPQETKGRSAWTAELLATLALSWPLVLTNLAQHGLMASDVILIGRIGPEALAAAALGTNIYFAFLIFGIGLVGAVSPLIAEELGRRRHSVREVRRTVRQGFWASVTVTVPIWIVLWNGEALLRLMGQDPGLSRDAGAYIRTLQWSVLPFLFYLVLRSFLAALERPGWALVVSLAGIPVNVGAAFVLIFGHFGVPAFGLVGAGYATFASTIFMCLCLVAIISRERRLRRYHLFGRFWRPDWPRFRALWRIGLPIGLTLAFEVTVFNVTALLMGRLGVYELAAHNVTLQIAALCFMVPLGIGQAVTVRVGRAFGAGDPEGVTRAGWIAYALGVGFMALTALMMLVVPGALVGVFLDLNDPRNAPVISLAMTFLVLAAIFQLADGAQAVGAGVLRGLQDTRVPMIIAAVGYWGIGLPLGIALAFGTSLRGIGIWIGLATGLAVVAALMSLRWIQRDRLGLVTGTPQPIAAREAFAG
ncbi:MAG: MATE family efflux transporter [Microvirga sp.]